MPGTDSAENVFIPLADGVRLAATLYLPATMGPWPALLEAYPYRKDDLSEWADEYRRLRDEADYAVCRLDTRGTGTSEGVAIGEYPPQEADDLCQVIAWLAAQEWCTGAVGMFGTSYSGFNTIHTAIRRPPALKAIIPIYATDDRYTDDVHFGGGIRKAIEFGYPLFMVSMNALPPVPALAGPDWRDRWLERIDALEPWFASIPEQNDSPYWRYGSLRPDYRLIQVPTMLVGGWSDLYRNAMLRMIERLDVPRRLVMGPWGHMATSDSIPGPRIDLVPEMIRWWNRWLRGIQNGVDREPMVALFVRRTTAPAPDLSEYAGEWRSEPQWPPARRRDHVLALAEPGAPARTLAVRGDVGTTAHIRGSYTPPYGLAIDQRPDEIHSLVVDWPVDAPLEILGNPRLSAALRSTTPVAFLSAKLCEVLPDGTSALVTRGLLNLTHRESDTDPAPLVPGELYTVEVDLDVASWVFTPGNRIRLALAGADWPNAWPPPHAGELTVDVAAGRLVLPVMDGPAPDADPPAFVSIPGDAVRAGGARRDASWRIEHDVYARESRVVVESDVVTPLATGGSARMTDQVRVGVLPHEPGTAWVKSTTDSVIEWPEVTARALARLTLRTDAETWFFDLGLQVFENGDLLRERRWQSQTPRLLQ